MIGRDKYAKILRAIRNYLIFFLIISFLVTCTTMLFVTTLSSTLGVTLTGDNLGKAAKLTFGNVVLLSMLLFAADVVRRKLTVDKYTSDIAKAAKRLSDGDFTARVRKYKMYSLDDSLGEIVDCFNKLAQELSSVETLRSDFIANVSHEIKTPLSVISNYASLLASSDISEAERPEYAKTILSAANRLSDMISNILRLSRLENQEIFPKKERYDLSEQLCECLLVYEEIWEKKNITIETEIDDAVEITADRELMSHVWNNLFSNAFKFTPDGGTVALRLTMEEKLIIVSVSDTGCGMSQEVGEHIFEKFYQGDTSHATAGNGLGLALVKRIIDIVDGEISVDSTLGKGSIFTVKLYGGDVLV